MTTMWMILYSFGNMLNFALSFTRCNLEKKTSGRRIFATSFVMLERFIPENL